MTSSPETTLSLDDGTVVLAATSVLDSHTIRWAATVCEGITDPDEKWQAFLRAFAVAGFEKWLQEGAFEVSCDYERSQPPPQGVNLRVGRYRLCILPIGSMSEPLIPIVTSSIAGDSAAHLYILINVQEEIDQIQIIGGLRQDQLLTRIQTQEGAPSQDLSQQQYLSISLDKFKRTPSQILMYLHCLEPEALSQTAISSAQTNNNTLLTGLINTGQWLKNQLDHVSQTLGWVLFPPITAVSQMRPISTGLADLVRALSAQDALIPPEAKGAGGPICVEGIACRLYAWVWPLSGTASSEWCLLVSVGPETGTFLPPDISLTVRDQTQIIAEETLAPGIATAHLYTQVIGSWREQLLVEVKRQKSDRAVQFTFSFEPDTQSI
ncbi:MAG: DUF1822 family protein [Cyanobacteria bacterium J06555_13]